MLRMKLGIIIVEILDLKKKMIIQKHKKIKKSDLKKWMSLHKHTTNETLNSIIIIEKIGNIVDVIPGSDMFIILGMVIHASRE
jgi:hypothetical protein